MLSNKGLIRCLEIYSTKHNHENNFKIMARQFPNISKWTMNLDIDNKISNNCWSNPTIIDLRDTNFLEFHIDQFIGNAIKQLYFGTQRFP